MMKKLKHGYGKSLILIITGIITVSTIFKSVAQTDVLYKEDFENYSSEGAFGDAAAVNGWLQNSVAPNNAIRNLWCSYSGENYCPSCTNPTAAVRIINGVRSAQICYINASNTIAYDGTYYGVGTYNTTVTTADRCIFHSVTSVGYQNIILTFNWKCAGEIYNGSPVDYGQIGYRIGTSGNWIKLTTGGYNNTGYLCNTAQNVNAATYSLPSTCNNTTFQIAFFWNNDETGGSGPAFIVDDIQVVGTRISSDYCRPYHQYANCSPWNDCQYVGITNVSCGSINNTSTITNTPPAYADFTAFSTNVDAGSAYNVGVRYTDNGNPVNYGRLAVWIDFNGDLDFLDANEFLGQQQATATNQTKNFGFTVPADAYDGSVAMRVRCAYNDEGFTSTDPCATRDYGETEDYTLNISNPTCAAPTLSAMANGVAGSTTECNGDQVTLSANASGGADCAGTWEYAWSNGTHYWNGSAFSSVSMVWNAGYSSIQFNVGPSTATYTAWVACSSEESCSSQSSVLLVIPVVQAGPIAGADSAVINNSYVYTTTLHSGSTYSWIAVGGSVQAGDGTYSADILWTTLGNDSIIVIETDVNGCTDTTTFQVFVDVNTGFNEPLTSQFSIYPNPANDAFYVIFPEGNEDIVQIRVIDLTGRVIIEKNGLSSSKEFISIGNVDEGIYYLELETEKQGRKVFKIAICK